MKKAIQYLFLAFLIAFTAIRGVFPGWTKVHSDFANYYVAAKLVTEGTSLDTIYDNKWFQQEINKHGIDTQGKFAPFPPATAWVMIPLTPFTPLTAQRIMVLVNLIFITFGILLIKKITHLQFHQCAILIFGAGLGLANNIAFGQLYWIMTVFILLSIILIKKGYSIGGGMILSVFIAIKYFPIVFIGGYFVNSIVSKNKSNARIQSGLKAVLAAAFTGLAIVAAGLIFFKGEVIKQFISSVLIPHLDGVLVGQGSYTFHFQSWESLLRNLFVKHSEFNPSPWIDWPAGKTIFKILITVIVLGSMTMVLYSYRLARGDKRRSVYLALPALAALVLLPASATYHFILLIIPLVLILSENLLKRKFLIAILITYFLIGVIPYGLFFELGKSIGLLFAYPRLWLISVFYAIVLFGLMEKQNYVRHAV
ncbi:hypothetical protein BH10BAC4_BH10BAC4_13690 [soil metagenome]